MCTPSIHILTCYYGCPRTQAEHLDADHKRVDVGITSLSTATQENKNSAPQHVRGKHGCGDTRHISKCSVGAAAEHTIASQLDFPSVVNSNSYRTPSTHTVLPQVSPQVPQQLPHRDSTSLCSSSRREVAQPDMMSTLCGFLLGQYILWPPQHLSDTATHLGA